MNEFSLFKNVFMQRFSNVFESLAMTFHFQGTLKCLQPYCKVLQKCAKHSGGFHETNLVDQ